MITWYPRVPNSRGGRSTVWRFLGAYARGGHVLGSRDVIGLEPKRRTGGGKQRLGNVGAIMDCKKVGQGSGPRSRSIVEFSA